jgi:cardiolipin synthase
MPDVITEYMPHLIAGLSVVFSAIASAHAIMYKRESRAAAAWVGLIWLSPFLGAGIYLLIGVNRIRRRAVLQRHKSSLQDFAAPVHEQGAEGALQLAIDELSGEDRQTGHCVKILENGDQAYPEMQDAIRQAKESIHLCTYIFDADAAGLEFLEVLAEAVERGVDVRVIIDDVGANYSFPSIVRRLRKAGIQAVRFGRTLWPWHVRYANLRNHRKILVVDGELAFAGGMNIRAGHVLELNSKHPIRDLHFRFEGPVVHQLDYVFCEDWELATREQLVPGPARSVCDGKVQARCLADGPDHPLDRIRWTILAALACSTKRVRIVTPYFVPDEGLITALCMASLRGVEVEIFLSAANNLRTVKWATQAMLWQVLQRGCRVFMTPAPFDHSKLLLVDDDWCLVGSANWDTRSLRLNFEVNVECQDEALVGELHALVDAKLLGAHEVTLEEVDARSLPVRFRDGVARLFSPYL